MFKQNISSKIAIFGLEVLAIFLGDLKFKQWRNQQAIEANIAALKVQENEREQKNNELSKSLAYLNSTDFKEKVAREQLGFKKSGETVYGFSDPAQAQPSTEINSTPKLTNPQKWWTYFFN